ncbi:MAG TPA: phage terminase large subunit family protein, partial [Bryobacteraceae bacterium]|nr:phage terminase large subunit family protein [Bryobacteraceae bacterium]
FPRYEEEYFRQLTSESFIKGHWVLGANTRNEALDARVYARAAASIYGIDRFAERHWRELEAAVARLEDTSEVTADTASPTEPLPIRRVVVRSNWIRR